MAYTRNRAVGGYKNKGEGGATPVDKAEFENFDSALDRLGNGGAVPFNVKDYGAVGNGSTDDTAAVTAAIAAMPAQGGDSGSGVLFFPAGTFAVSGVTLPANKRIHLMGAGAGISTLFLKSGSNTDVLTLAARTGGSDGWWHEVSNIQIDGNKAGNSSGHGITVLSARTQIHHCNITLCAGDGVHADAPSFALSSSGNSFHHLYLVNNNGHGLYLGANAFDPFLTDLFVYLNGGDGINSQTTNVFAKGVHVANNTGNGISLVAATAGGYGMWSDVYAHLNTLRGVSVTGASETGHRFGNCQFIGNGTGGMYISTTNGRTGLIASLVKDNTGPGVEIASCNFNLVDGCQFLDFQGTKTQTYGIVTTGTADFQLLSDNICRSADHLTGGMNLAGTNNTVAGSPGSGQAMTLQERIQANQGITMKTKAGAAVDGDFTVAPPDGTMVVDTSAAKIGVRLGGGTWKYGEVLVSAPVATKTAAYTASSNDRTIIGDATTATFQVTLPSSTGLGGRRYTVKKKDASANAVTVGTTSSQTIDGAATYSLGTQWKYVTVESDGTNWIVVGNN